MGIYIDNDRVYVYRPTGKACSLDAMGLPLKDGSLIDWRVKHEDKYRSNVEERNALIGAIKNRKYKDNAERVSFEKKIAAYNKSIAWYEAEYNKRKEAESEEYKKTQQQKLERSAKKGCLIDFQQIVQDRSNGAV